MKIKGHGSIIPLENKSRYKCRKWRLFVSTECGQRTRVFDGTWKEACKALEAFKIELEAQIPNPDTFAAYAASWLAWREESGELAPGTIENNKREIAALNRSELSTVRLDSITPEMCRDALMWIKNHPVRNKTCLSNTTMNKIFITLSAILRQAVDDERLTRNPMDKIKPPKPDTKEKQALTPEQLSGFVRDLDSLPLDGRTMAVYFMALLALRRAEACALSPNDIDGNIVCVHLAIKERTGKIAEPKSKASIRFLPMPSALVDKVDEWTEKRVSDGLSGALTLCCNTRGGILLPQNLQRWWTGDAKHNGVRDAIGHEKVGFHLLRHSNLSMMARHMSPFDLQRYAGWSSIEPAKVYIHGDFSQLERAIALVDW